MGTGLTGRRAMQIITSGDSIGAVEFDGETLTLKGQARLILGKLREAHGDDVKLGRDLMEHGWMNMVVELGPVEDDPTLDEIQAMADEDGGVGPKGEAARGRPYPGQRYRHGWIPVAASDLSQLSEDELTDAFHAAGDDEDELGRIDREFARREGHGPDDDLSTVDDDSPAQRRIDTLVAGGMSYRDAYAEAHDLDPDQLEREDLAALVDARRVPGETRTQAVRRLYDEYVHVSYLRAEAWTNGHLLSPAGRNAGIDPITLFSGQRARPRRYASEELKRFWDEVEPRQTYTEFRAAMLGRRSDLEAAKKITQNPGRDFGL